ncbi:MAG: bifunctional oligoribonuclease/PAP phosphatase NrnA [Candidatus Aminicenantes bacterium]|nr:bifunctional oligoribonuclease/PAP phosphatase NrnA [Candidatus Aminicenantes bacterium]
MKKKISNIIKDSEKIAISSHVRPDADSIGSGLALYLMLKQMGKEVQFLNTDKAPYPLTRLPHYNVIKLEQIYPQSFDTFILIEGGTESRTGQKHIDKYFTINIDHHTTSSLDADINWVIPEAAAVGELIYELGIELDIRFTRDIGFNLYATIISDTGSFKYSNTTFRSLRIASELVEKCLFSPDEVSNLLFNSNHYEKVQMIPKVLSTLELKLDNKVSIIEFRRKFLKSLNLKDIETEDIIAIARSIDGVQVTLFFKEIENDLYRVSIRSKGEFSSQSVARKFNGGGHDHAAGFFYRGNIIEGKEKILAVIHDHLSDCSLK